MFGLQTWVAMPAAHEEDAPFFAHTAKEELPLIEDSGARVRLVTGTAWRRQSPAYTVLCSRTADGLPAADWGKRRTCRSRNII